jgi:hypothetical protein
MELLWREMKPSNLTWAIDELQLNEKRDAPLGKPAASILLPTD